MTGFRRNGGQPSSFAFGVRRSSRGAAALVAALLLAADLAPLALPGVAVAVPDLDGVERPSSEASAPKPPALADEIARKKEALRAEFDILRRKLEAAAQATSFVDRQALLDEVAVLQEIQRSYEQQAAVAQGMEESVALHARLDEELSRVRAAEAAGARAPATFAMLDRLEDDLESQGDRLATLESAVEYGTEAVEQARAEYDAAERARRAAQEEAQLGAAAENAVELEGRARLARLRSQAAGEGLRLREIELSSERLERDTQQVRVALVREQVAQAAATARLTDEELAAQTLRFEQEEFEITQALAAVRREMMQAGGGAAADPQDLSAWQRQTRQLRAAVLNQRLQQLSGLKQLYSRRNALARAAVGQAELAAWAAESRREVERAAREGRLYLARLAELRRPLQVEGAAEPEATRSPEQQQEIESRLRTLEMGLGHVDGYRRAHERLLRQIAARAEREPWAARLDRVRATLGAAWAYEILAVQDRPITVGKVVFGVLLFLAGLWVAAFVSRFLGRRVWPRFGLDAGASAALQSLSYYLLVAVLTLAALEVVNVPLTIFTFVGGALAIGVGFGSQNLMNNFISGLILLAERPIKVGDLIEIGSLGGTVERIGARSTRLRSHRNIHVIVPNSHFLEKEVVNWTLGDDSVKTSVTVSISFGAPPERIRELLVEAVSHHEKVFTTPSPVVLLKNFNQSDLEFEIHFWLRTRSTMERWIVESDVRYRIDELLRKAGIDLPQRDVHLETNKPLEVHVRRE